ncbi:MAG: hypothetical protein IJK52_09505 [Oscillospiraceae bacterium]|nr:hypothetical protein [Oscillospiraceae bacterium]
MGLFDFLKPNKKYADSSTIPENERQYYQPDDYYTLNAFDGSMFERPVITFEERKKTCIPSENGLYVAEILLLDYCAAGKYPNPKSGYPGFWWFEYGIRDVGGALRSLENRGFIRKSTAKERVHGLTAAEMKGILSDFGLPGTGKKADLEKRLQESLSEQDLAAKIPGWKYVLTDLGKSELAENEYVPYMHKTKEKTTEGSIFGEEFTVWSVNKKLGAGDKRNWRDVVEKRALPQNSKLDKAAEERRAKIEKMLREMNPELYKSLDEGEAELQAAIAAEAQYKESKDVDAYIAFWESVWKRGQPHLGTRWTFTLPDLYIKQKRYDDALNMMKKIKGEHYQYKKAQYIERINSLKAKAAAKNGK